MTATYRVATDDMFGCVLAAWKTSPFTVRGNVAELLIAEIGEPRKIPGDIYWGRLSRQTINSTQKTLSNCVVNPGSVRYNEFGLIFIQLFGPRSDTQSKDKLAQQAEWMRNSLRRKNTGNGVWFRGARINELKEEEKFNRTNVIAEFSYDEIF